MKKIFLHIILFVFLVFFLANEVYVRFGFYEKDIQRCGAESIHRIDSIKQHHTLLYFSESSNFATAISDVSHESISELTARILKSSEPVAVNKSASHAGNYIWMIRRLKNSHVKAVILPLNLRSFGINWIQSDLESSLSRMNIMLRNDPPILKKFLITFKGYDARSPELRKKIIQYHYSHDELFPNAPPYRTVKEWDAYMFSRGHTDPSGNRIPEKCELACHYIKNYGFIIGEDNPRIRDFDAICEFCNKNNILLILNFLPENLEKARELCGLKLLTLMEYNHRFLLRRYGSKALIADNFSLLPDSCFIDKTWPTEHYNYFGRNKIALKLSEIILTKHIIQKTK